ncbi:KamA family radical SAM protein [Pigmentibacter sp. JX0631]|uniref:KamA family radical SAM protein n=1 Tax=Pigmentibacter sp. JX0631 TaxID=2976982 RepID=UPI002468FAEC|nr:KamA family radical SAM protein [Pigmentibacter sp. JX0631]WGL59362.1 KamA family radical SAM protein [Pigmentibacter sp. JX0631]
MKSIEKNWAKELAKGIITAEQLLQKKFIAINEVEKIELAKENFDIRVPNVFLDAIDKNISEIKKQFVPSAQELNFLPEELEDPIGDERWTPVSGITHRYPDRVLLKLTYMCASYCRFCFRRYKVSDSAFNLTTEQYHEAIEYIKNNKDIWEVILTGGDPLTLTDQKLKNVLEDLDKISHVKIVRFHTRIPSVLPARINDSLIKILKSIQKQIVFVIHINSHHEFNVEAIYAIKRLRAEGFSLLMQSVLLKDINDDQEKLIKLLKIATENGIKPYYLHYLDLAKGTEHFRVPLRKAINLYNSLRGLISGICIPEFILDIPGGKGKISLQSSSVKELENNCWQFISPIDGSKIVIQYPAEV